ncbi:PIN domain-containing protein [Candidatus Bathyarchaeota archaeon]|nr:PIN domain-containing protein [Candidatus Bathyarchaeota archaeon]
MKELLLDLTTIISAAFRGERYHENAARLYESAQRGLLKLHVLDILILEAEHLYLTGRVRVDGREWQSFILDILENPRIELIMMDREIFKEHLRLYREYGGKYTYFDSFYAAAAITHNLKLVTTDRRLLEDEEIPTEDLRKY